MFWVVDYYASMSHDFSYYLSCDIKMSVWQNESGEHRHKTMSNYSIICSKKIVNNTFETKIN